MSANTKGPAGRRSRPGPRRLQASKLSLRPSLARGSHAAAKVLGVALLGMAYLAGLAIRRLWLGSTGLASTLDAVIGGVLAVALAAAGVRLVLVDSAPRTPTLPAEWERWTARGKRRQRRALRMRGAVAASAISLGIVAVGQVGRTGHGPPATASALLAAAGLIGYGLALVLRTPR